MTDETKAEETKDKEIPLSEEIGKAWDELAVGEAETPPEETKSEGDAEQKTETEAAREAEDGSPDEGADEGAEVEPKPVEAPEHWAQSDKDAFNALPEEIRPLYLEKAKSLESGYGEKFEQLAQDRKAVEPLREFEQLFAPMQQTLIQAGVSPAQYVRNLMSVAAQLDNNPRDTLLGLAQRYKVDFAAQPEGDLDDVDPAVAARLKALEGTVSNVSSHLTQAQTAQATASQQQYDQLWSEFSQAKDEAGNLLRPQAERLRESLAAAMGTLKPEAGETLRQQLDRAYDNVIWSDPEARAGLLKAEDAKRDNARKAAVEKAKKAGQPVKSRSAAVGEAPKPADSWKEQLEHEWDRLAQAG